MLNNFLLFPVNLRLFDGEGGDAAASSATGETQALPGTTRRGKTGETIKYGKQPEAAPDSGSDAGSQGGTVTSNTLEDRRRTFREMIDGEFKDVYTEETQRMINRRFSETKTLEDTLGKYQPIIDILSQRYKIEDGDMAKLSAAIENDNAYWSEAADEAGMTVEQYKSMQKIQRENEALKREVQRRESQTAQQQIMRQWTLEAEQLKTTYPSFDLGRESENPQFVAMLRSRVPMKNAYEVLHMDEITAGVAQMTAKATEEQVVANIRARGSRPGEAGASSRSAFTVKDDVSKLSKADRAEIAKRVARGEKISF